MTKKNKKTPEKKIVHGSSTNDANTTKKVFVSADSKTSLLLEDPTAKIYKSICWTCPGIIKPEAWLTKEDMLTKNEDHKKEDGKADHDTDYKVKHTKILFFE